MKLLKNEIAVRIITSNYIYFKLVKFLETSRVFHILFIKQGIYVLFCIIVSGLTVPTCDKII